MNLQPRVEAWGAGDQSWLASRHGVDVAKTVTLDGKKFTTFKDVIPAGVPLKEGAGGLFEPLTDPATDKLAGFLLTAKPAFEGNIVAPLVWHGRVLLGKLPEGAADLSELADTTHQFTLEAAK